MDERGDSCKSKLVEVKDKAKTITEEKISQLPAEDHPTHSDTKPEPEVATREERSTPQSRRPAVAMEMSDGGGGDAGDDEEDTQSNASSEDVDLLLIAQESDSSDDSSSDEGQGIIPRTTGKDDTSKTETSQLKQTPHQSIDADDDDDVELVEKNDVEYKVKITRFGGGNFEGFEITHEPVCKIPDVKDDSTEEKSKSELSDNDSGGDDKMIEKMQTSPVSKSPEIIRPSLSHGSPTSGKGQTLSPSNKSSTQEIHVSRVGEHPGKELDTRQPLSPSEHKTGMRLPPSSPTDRRSSSRFPPSSPTSSEFKPSTPGTLSSRSSTSGSLDESVRSGLGESTGSTKLRSMRDSTRVRRESREQREREERLQQSEKSRERSRTKSEDDIARRRSSTPRSFEDDTPVPKTKSKMIRAGFEFKAGFKLEAMDYLNKWYPAKIMQVDESRQKILIHFEGWNSRYDEWVYFNSPKLRPHARTSHRKDGFKEAPVGGYRVGDEVLARWSDCRYYPGKIISINETGSYRIIFYDGIEKNVQGINVRDMPEELKQQDFFSNLQAQIERAMKNADQRRLKRQKAAERLSSTPSSAGSSPPEERKRRLSSPTPSPGQVKRSKGSTEEVKGSDVKEGVKTGHDVKLRKSSQEGVKRTGLVIKDDQSESEEKVASKSISGVTVVKAAKPGVARKGHFLMGGSVMKREDKGAARPVPGKTLPATIPSKMQRGRGNQPKEIKPAARTLPIRSNKEARLASLAAAQKEESSDIAQTAAKEGSIVITDSSKVTPPPAAPPARARPGHVIIPVIETISMDERLQVAQNLEKLRAKASKEPLFSPLSIVHLKDPTKFIAPKELIVDLDHNKFKCEVEGCGKAFRKASLLESHKKYYHTELVEAGPDRSGKDKDKPAQRPRKRNYSATMSAPAKVRRESGNSSSSATSPSPSSPPAKLSAKRSSAPSTLSSSSQTPSQAPKKSEPSPLRSPKSPPPKSPMSPPPPPAKAPMSPPTSAPLKTPKLVSSTPKSPTGALAKESKSPKEEKMQKETKFSKEARSPKEAKSPKELSKPTKDASGEGVKLSQTVKMEKADKGEGFEKTEEKKPSDMVVKTKMEKKMEKRSSLDEKGHHPGGDEGSVKAHKMSKQSPGVATGDTKKSDKTSPKSSDAKSAVSRSSIPGVTSIKKEEGVKESSAAMTKHRDGIAKISRIDKDKLKHKKHKEKDKHKKHKEKKKKKKREEKVKEKEKEKKKKKKKKKKRQRDGGKMSVIRSREKFKDIDDYLIEKKKRDFQFEMPVPMSEYKSESFGRHVAPILKSQLLRSLDGTDGGERATGNGETVRCICYRKTEEGFMIQCEKCLCWQHSSCVGLTKSTVPDHYVCLICFNPRDQRVAAKYRYGQKWFQDGDLAAFSSAPKQYSKEAAHSIAATNRLIGEMHLINFLLRGLKEKLHILQTPNHPDLKLWARSWEKQEEEEKPDEPSPTATGPVPNLDLSLTLDPNIPLGESIDTEASLTPLETEQIARIMAMSCDPEIATLVNLIQPCDVGMDSSASSMIDGSLMKEDQNLGEMEMEAIQAAAGVPGGSDAMPMGISSSDVVQMGVLGTDGTQDSVPDTDSGVPINIPGSSSIPIDASDTEGVPLGVASSEVSVDVAISDSGSSMGVGGIQGFVPADMVSMGLSGIDGGSNQSTPVSTASFISETTSITDVKEKKDVGKSAVVDASKGSSVLERLGNTEKQLRESARLEKLNARFGGDDFAPPTVKFVTAPLPPRRDNPKFVTSTGTHSHSKKEDPVIDISDIPSTSAGPSQRQLEAAGMMRIQPLTHGGRFQDAGLTTDETSLSEDDDEDDEEEMEVEESTDVAQESMDESQLSDSDKYKDELDSSLSQQQGVIGSETTTQELKDETSVKSDVISESNETSASGTLKDKKSKTLFAAPTPSEENDTRETKKEGECKDSSVADSTTQPIKDTMSVKSDSLDNQTPVEIPSAEGKAMIQADKEVQKATLSVKEYPLQTSDSPSVDRGQPTSSVNEQTSDIEQSQVQPVSDEPVVLAQTETSCSVSTPALTTETSCSEATPAPTTETSCSVATPARTAETTISMAAPACTSETSISVATPARSTEASISVATPAFTTSVTPELSKLPKISGVALQAEEGSEAPVAVPECPGVCQTGETKAEVDSLEQSTVTEPDVPGPSGIRSDGEQKVSGETNDKADPNKIGDVGSLKVPVSSGLGSAGSENLTSPTFVESEVAQDVPGPLGTASRDPHDIPGPSGIATGPSKDVPESSGISRGIHDVAGPSGIGRGQDQSLLTYTPNQPPLPTAVPGTSTDVPGTSSWVPFQNADSVASTSADVRNKKEEVEEVSPGRRVIKVARTVCVKNLKDHIEYLEAELEKRMDIIEEEANALEQQFAELPGLSPDIRGLATMNDSFLKSKLSTLHGDVERISNLVAL